MNPSWNPSHGRFDICKNLPSNLLKAIFSEGQISVDQMSVLEDMEDMSRWSEYFSKVHCMDSPSLPIYLRILGCIS